MVPGTTVNPTKMEIGMQKDHIKTGHKLIEILNQKIIYKNNTILITKAKI